MRIVCFDLDDTLYKEVEYLQSAYRDIARALWGEDWLRWYEQMVRWYEAGENVFERVCSVRKDVEMGGLLNMYRFDLHGLCLSDEVEDVLAGLKADGVKLGLITDGRSVTQWNKIRALGLERFFDEGDVVISEEFGSEKPAAANYEYFMRRYPGAEFTYVADNPRKDFVGANVLGWMTVCLMDDGRNVHGQVFDLPEAYLPAVRVGTISEVVGILDQRE